MSWLDCVGWKSNIFCARPFHPRPGPHSPKTVNITPSALNALVEIDQGPPTPRPVSFYNVTLCRDVDDKCSSTKLDETTADDDEEVNNSLPHLLLAYIIVLFRIERLNLDGLRFEQQTNKKHYDNINANESGMRYRITWYGNN